MAKWKVIDDLNIDRLEEKARPEYTWDRNDFGFTEEQLAYMNGTAMQELMHLIPDYDEAHKRRIYAYVIAQLADFAVHEYWRLQHQERGN